MTKADYIKILVEGIGSPEAVMAANRVLDAVKHWNGFSVGAQPLSLQVHLPEAYVAKVLAVIARQGFLVPTPYVNVYRTVGAKYHLQYAGQITPQGFITHADPGVEQYNHDVWGGSR